MSPELTSGQILRAIAALEAAWAKDHDALSALMRGGHDEQPLSTLVAQYGASRLQVMVLTVTGITGLEGDDQREALAELQEGLIPHMTMLAVNMMNGWALSAGTNAEATGDLARRVLVALLSFTTDGDDPQQVRMLLAHLRTDALTHS